MIVSKKQRLDHELSSAILDLQAAITTQRGAASARAELRQLREESFVTNTCPYCQMTIVDRSVRHSESCKDCGSKLDRLLMTKSKILTGSKYNNKALSSFTSDMLSLKYVPYSLGGTNVDEVTDACKAIDEVLDRIKAFNKEENAKQFLERMREKRLRELRLEYSRYVHQYTPEEFEKIIQSQYALRYPED